MKKLLFSALTAAAVLLTACGQSADKGSSVIEKTKSGAAPVLALSNTEGKAGETVEVTLSVRGADNMWSSSGIHILYDESLTCVATENDPQVPESTLGEAVVDMTACISLIWTENKIQELIDKKMDSVFFCSASSGNVGKDGDLVTYKFVIPENAEVGTVYDMEFFYREGDMFVNAANDADFQEYAFSHWENGTITVTE